MFGVGKEYGEIAVSGIVRASAGMADLQVLSILHKRVSIV